jgi:hypothetical protein
MHSGIRLLSAASASLRYAHWSKTISLVALAGAFAGCGGDGDDGGDGGGGSGGGLPDAVLIEDNNNYDSESTLTPPIIDTAPAVNLRICWPDLTIDMQCHEIDPTVDIGQVALLKFGVDTVTPEPGEDKYEAIARRLTEGELPMEALDGVIQYETNGATCANLSDLTNFGTPVDYEERYVEDADAVYMMVWGSGTVAGVGTRAMVFLNPTADSLNEDVTADLTTSCNEDGEGILTFTADFQDPLAVPAGDTLFNWRNVEFDGLGNDIAAGNIDRILLARYDTLTAEDLETRVFDLELLADDLWEFADFKGGYAFDVLSLEHADTGAVFEGFAEYPEGTWLLGHQCTTCQNPAPLILTELQPEL